MTSQTKYLGLILDEHLTFKYHLQNLKLKLNRANCLLSKIRYSPCQIPLTANNILCTLWFIPKIRLSNLGSKMKWIYWINWKNTKQIVFLTQIISRWQKKADMKVVFSISRQQKWNLHRQFSKNCNFPNIQLKGVVNRLPPFKNLSDHTNKFLMG